MSGMVHDSEQLSLKKYALFCEQMVEVENQLIDWKRYYLQKTNKQ
jgi:hypothetical protein